MSRTAILVAIITGLVLLGGAAIIAAQLIRPMRANLEMGKATQLYRQGRTKEALAAYERVVKLYPKHAGAWADLGIAAYDLGDLKKSADAYRKAIALDNTLSVAHNNLAYVLFDQDKFDEAVSEWEKAVQHLGKSPMDEQGTADCWAGLAIGYLAQGKQDKAVRTYRRAVTINPQYFSTEWMVENAFWSPKAIEAAEKLIPLVKVSPTPVPEGPVPSV